MKKAIKQIQDAPGGIILDYGENEISDTILGVIKRRIERSRLTSVDVMLLQDGKLVSVLRHKKWGPLPPRQKGQRNGPHMVEKM